jgi:hypothetical protein
MTFSRFATDVLRAGYSRAQRVFSLVAFDGVSVAALDDQDREIALQLFGEIGEVPATARRAIVGNFGRGSGKTQLAGDYLLFRMLTADLTSVGPGDVGTAISIAPDVKLATIAKRRAHARAQATPSIAKCIEQETSEGFVIRRPQDGKACVFEVLAATRAGSAGRGRSIVAAVLDEAAFFRDEQSAVNDAQVFGALAPRLLRGGAILLFSTPWSEIGEFHRLYTKNKGNPTTALAAHGPSILMRDNDPDVLASVAAETERDPVNAAREFGAEFIGLGSSSFFDPALIDSAVDDEYPFPSPPERSRWAFCADLGFRMDASALCVIQNLQDVARVAYLDEVAPTVGAPLVPSVVLSRFGREILRYGGSHCYFDGTYLESVRELVWKIGLAVFELPAGRPGKLEQHMATRELLAEKKIRIPRHARLIHQLKSILVKPTAGGGLSISTPRRSGQFHGDLASSFVGAAWAVRNGNANQWQRDALIEHSRRLEAIGSILAGQSSMVDPVDDYAERAREARGVARLHREANDASWNALLNSGGSPMGDAWLPPVQPTAEEQARLDELHERVQKRLKKGNE